MKDLAEEISQVIAPLVGREGLELFKVKMERQNHQLHVEVFVDRPNGGITIDECAAINKRIAKEIDEENLISDEYFLEVSSPGIDWPLETKKDYLRAIHKKVRFLLLEAIDDKQEYIGVINEVNEGQVAIVCDSSEGLVIPIEKIRKAVQII